MAYTDVQICNLSLSRLGDEAGVVSISAPTTRQERLCATFYPLARDVTLEKHQWDFATVRKALVVSTALPPSTWKYCYDIPTGMMDFISILDPDATNDYTAPVVFTQQGAYTAPVPNLGVPTPWPFVVEWDETTSKRVIYTDMENAVGRYTIGVTATTSFSAQFVDALAYRLASYLAGPLIKGDVGVKVASDMEKAADKRLVEAAGKDANQRDVHIAHGADWIVGRG